MERWLSLCERDNWQMEPEMMQLIQGIFGASWYFTRYVFYRGAEAFHAIRYDAAELTADRIREKLVAATGSGDIETDLESLRLVKNEVMLRIFSGFLTRALDQAATEAALTRLAELTLDTALDIVFIEKEHKNHFAVLGMGRMAGEEMTFGSDLDLIFLYSVDSSELFNSLGRRVRTFLREIASLSPAGILYEVDTRLRPHGNSGVLLTSANAFEEHHASETREIWERQMMTRCRPVYDDAGIARHSYGNTLPYIYREYDPTQLRTEIGSMRFRVERELGRPAGKYDIKRGKGGIMDVDFISHYFQLAHGHAEPSLQTASTRKALAAIAALELFDPDRIAELTAAYDYLKRVEACLRVHDMKSIDGIHRQTAANHVVARAMGHVNPDGAADTRAFMHEYLKRTRRVRRIFTDIFGALDD